MQRCAFCTRYLNPKAVSCGYCGKKLPRPTASRPAPKPVELPPLEYAGGVVALSHGGHGSSGPGHGGTALDASAVELDLELGDGHAPGELDLAALATRDAPRRRWWRGGGPRASAGTA